MHPDSSSELDPSSSCSPAAPGGDTPGCSLRPPDSLSSSVDSAKVDAILVVKQDGDTSAPAAFVPSVTAISTSPELKWMVQPTAITSGFAKTKTDGANQSSPTGAKRAKTCNKKAQKEQPSKEDEERRRIRRERNKIAAAKCRNRRRELIDSLQAETDSLEEEKSTLQTEIADLLKEKERLEHILASHQSSCKLPALDDSDMEEEEEEKAEDVDSVLQDPPASPPLLSILENVKTPESNVAAGEVPASQDADLSCVPASAAILGNSNILLCSSAEEEALQDLNGDDLDDLVPSLEMAASVPDIDLSGPFCLPDWETLYKSVASDLESLTTPVISSSPTCSSFRTVFSFSCSEIESMAEDCEGLKGSHAGSELMKDSLNSPTLLAL
ncbi:PREDICTED: proto-oncogene c-Fos-like isoform X1 [Poecilia mexicana]|uniref:proto-oncogene c-Fos-like isoform X1 n=1 Tax=Poecilia mexicana TaxID=48701 RepID=UPI00072E4B43|nr:PREDICTED: proto-oncogene c-Fos-like isoform X1 [Poecilia mexicana]XP_016527395.1 PREDICTED: proto-oncogene c-Fos-like isoform X1 [Poecilia formosa]